MAVAPMITIEQLLNGKSPATKDEAVALLAQVAAAQSRLAAVLAGLAEPSTEDRLLDVDEAAAKLGQTRDWLYRRTRTLPFVVRLDGSVRYSLRGIEAHIAAKRGR